MASNTVLKTPRISDFPETDPLAELSRIMGLAREEAANSSEPEFEIDLEQELMGEFMHDERKTMSDSGAARGEDETDLAPLEAEFDDAFADMLAQAPDEEPAADEPVAAPAVDLAAQEETLAHDLVDLDAAFEGFDFSSGLDLSDSEARVEQPADATDEMELAAADLAPVADEEPEPVAAELEAGPAEEPAATADDEVADIPAIAAPAAAAVAATPVAAAPAAAKPVSAVMSIEDELRVLLGRVNTPIHRAPMAANDGGRAEARAAFVPPAAPATPVAAAPATPVAAAGEDDRAAADDIQFDAADFESLAQPDDAEPVATDHTVEERVAQLDDHSDLADDLAIGEDELAAGTAEDLADGDLDDLAADLPAYDDFDASEFEDVELAAALAETLASDAQLNAAAEAEYAKHIAKEAMVALNSTDYEEDVADHDDMAIDLEAELASFSEDEIVPMKPEISSQPVETAPAALRPLTFTEERRAAAETAPQEAAPAFDWRKRYADMKTAAQAPAQPVAQAPEPRSAEPDPFAALAALAAQPPVVRNFSRTNPVAVDAGASERAPRPAASTSADAAPAGRGGDVSPALASWRAQTASTTMARPAPAPAPVPAVPPRAETYAAPVDRSAPPAPAPARPEAASPLRSGLGATAGGFAAGSAFAPRPAAAAPAPSVPAAAPEAPEDDFADLASLLDDMSLAPEIETVEISDQAVALADELDIPDLVRDEPAVAPMSFDDLDADFADAFQQLSLSPAPKPAAAPHRAPVQPEPAADYYVDRAPEPAQDAYAAGVAPDDGRGERQVDYGDQLAAFDPPLDRQGYADEEFAFDDNIYVTPQDERRPARGRGLMIAAAVAGVVIVGGVGAYAFMGGSTGDGAPVLVKADPSPVKVKPENPGGVVVPNQDGQVYDQVRGQPVAVPAQDKLVSGAEEPIAPAPRPAAPVADSAPAEAAAPAAPAEPAAAPIAAAPEATAPEAAAPAASVETALPGVEAPLVKSEERVTAEDSAQTSAQSSEIAAIAPRKVRTMIVRADGTLVPREEAPASAETTGTPMQTMPSGADPATLAAAQPGAQIPSAVPGAQDDVSILPAEDAAPQVEAPAAADVIVPMPRPSRTAAPAAEQPVRQAAVAPQPARAATPAPQPAAAAVQEASAPAATAPVPSSLWSVQIASQPTREGAQSSYEDLARRYGSVLNGKGVNIVQAEVTGKGTMWRVRVPSASKNDANILCAKLKTAGGSCFVTQ